MKYDQKKLYGPAVNNPVKVADRSFRQADTGPGKGDWERPVDKDKFDKNYEKHFGKKYLKLYDGTLVEV